MKDHTNECEIPATGACTCHAGKAAISYAYAERDMYAERARFWRRNLIIRFLAYWCLFAALVVGRDLGWWG